MITDCLKSLQFVDEIIVIDTGSTDKTNTIARHYKARVIEFKTGNNFSDWRNKGLKEAKGEWIFYIDADERVTPELKNEILNTIKNENNLSDSAFAIPRRNIILGKELRYGGWYPDYVKRLYKKSSLKKWIGDLHEEPVFEGSMGHFNSALIHQKHETITEMVEKTNRWSEIEGKLMFDAGHPPMNIPRFLTAMWREFWQRMVLKRAFLDGSVGIIFAMYQVFSRFTSYAKLWELQVKAKKL